MNSHSEMAWSVVDPRPVLKYISSIDDYVVFWKGTVMPHSIALNLALEPAGIYPTPAMKAAMADTYRRFFYSGALGSRQWEDVAVKGLVYGRMRQALESHIRQLHEQHETQEILGWFDYERAVNHS